MVVSQDPLISTHPRLLPGRALDLDLNVHGAPNFRAPRQGNLNVFGVAQPRTQGLRAILSVLRCRPDTRDPSHVVWFSTREEPIGGFSVAFPEAFAPRSRLTEFLLNQFTYPDVRLSCGMRLSRARRFHSLIGRKISRRSKIG